MFATNNGRSERVNKYLFFAMSCPIQDNCNKIYVIDGFSYAINNLQA